MTHKNNQGFTLIELLFAVVVVAVLVTIAMPSYHKSVRKARRADARAALFELQINQERFRGNCIQFANAISTTSECTPGKSVYTLRNTAISPEGYYLLSIDNNNVSATGYVATASAVGAQTSDHLCKVITLTVSSHRPRGVITPIACQ